MDNKKNKSKHGEQMTGVVPDMFHKTSTLQSNGISAFTFEGPVFRWRHNIFGSTLKNIKW